MSTKKQKREKLQKAREETAKREFKYATAQTLIGIFALALMFFAWGSHLLPVTDPVESNYALTAKEMVLSGNWLSPQIYGHFWFDKPAMVYWLMSISYSLFGFTDFASRLPAAFCGAATITLLVWYIRRITKNNVVAVWSGIILATSLEFWIISHAIITDSMLMLFTVPTLLSAYIGLMENNRRHMVIAYFSSGLACLSKGPVGLVLPGMLLLIWCGLMRNKKLFLRLFPWQGILIFFITALPWYACMYAIHGDPFIREFLGLHNIVRATSSEHPGDNHFYYYFLLLPFSLLPWTGLFFYEIKKQWKEKTSFYLFLMVWCFGTLLFYTLMATKYVTYTYIALVPAAVLAAHAAPDVTSGKKIPGLLAIIPFPAAPEEIPENYEYKFIDFVNPEILAVSEDEETAYEGCLSFPGHNGAVTRPVAVKVRAQDRHGEWFELEAEDLLARCFQHENDHLDGITIMESSEFFYEDTEEGRAAAAKKKEND